MQAIENSKQCFVLGARTDIPDLLQVCDVFLFPSTKEGLPVSVVEAQAAGLPVVMSDSVTDEVCVTENVCRLSLSSSVHEWASKVVELGCAERKNRFEEMKSAGWDMYDSSKQLVAYYRG